MLWFNQAIQTAYVKKIEYILMNNYAFEAAEKVHVHVHGNQKDIHGVYH